MTSVRLSPGRLTSLWVILRSLQALGGSADRLELLRYASRTSLRAGGLPIPDGLTLALEGDFARAVGDHLSLAPLGAHAVALEDVDEPSLDARRLFMSVLLLRDPPPWVAYWQGDPGSLELVVPESELDLLREADLYPSAASEGIESWSWWQALRVVPLPEDTSELRKLIGDAGEELTFNYERSRLRASGHTHLADRVRWVARESPAYGYDVLSFHGPARPSEPERSLAIEVKSVSRPVLATLEFFLTAHEWLTAQHLGADHIIHFWDGVDPGPKARSSRPTPLLVPAIVLAPHIPAAPSCASKCSWFSTRIALPLGSVGPAGSGPATSARDG